jgi:hypothetical protein
MSCACARSAAYSRFALLPMDIAFWQCLFCFSGKWDSQLCFLFLCVTGDTGRKHVTYMPWPLAAECNMITNKQTLLAS